MIAVVIATALCVPAFAATQDTACCDEPWLENPNPGADYEYYDEDYHICISYTEYDCSHCNQTYKETDDASLESHSYDFAGGIIDPVNGTITYNYECVCGDGYSVSE